MAGITNELLARVNIYEKEAKTRDAALRLAKKMLENKDERACRIWGTAPDYNGTPCPSVQKALALIDERLKGDGE